MEFKQNKFEVMTPLAILLLLGALARIGPALTGTTYEMDMNTFKYWADQVYELGLNKFYSGDFFSDYPPGYMYVLYIVGAVKHALGLAFEGNAYTILMKTPAMLCDLAAGALVYFAGRKHASERAAFLLAALYLLNPAVLFDSAVWGQVDSVYMFLVALSLHYLTEKNHAPGFLIFALAVLVKPQALILSPVYIYCGLQMLADDGFSMDSFVSLIIYFVGAMAVLIIGVLPFTTNFNVLEFVVRYKDTIASYPYATVNAFNFYGLLNANWVDINETFLGVPFTLWGIEAIIIIVALCFFMLFHNHSKANIFFVAALANTLTFIFSVSMHERYLFGSMLLFLMSVAHNRDRRVIGLYCGFSVTFLLNCALILRNHLDPSFDSNAFMFPISFLNVSLAVLMLVVAFKLAAADNMPEERAEEAEGSPKDGPKDELESEQALTEPSAPGEADTAESSETTDPNPLENLQLDEKGRKMALSDVAKLFEAKKPAVVLGAPPEAKEPFHLGIFYKRDLILCAALVLFYTVIAFLRLGTLNAPVSAWEPVRRTVAVIDFGRAAHVDEIRYYVGGRPGGTFHWSYSKDNINWENGYGEDPGEVFTWYTMTGLAAEARYLKIEAVSDELSIVEMAFYENGQKLLIQHVTDNAVELVDEQKKVPGTVTFMDTMYFDEIYHARTAYEFIHHLPVYEWTHPPLGKVMISWGVAAFGMTPFGWRFVSALAGALALVPMYAFGKRLLKSEAAATLATFIFAFDFMHFVQGRIGTIDTFLVLFIICAAYFMFSYISLDFDKTPFSRTLVPLFFSGLFMGAAIAVKWTGVYAALGLAIVFFINFVPRMVKKLKAGEAVRKEVLKTAFWCFIFFVFIPVDIYLISYIPYLGTPSGADGLLSVYQNQLDIFGYHTGLKEGHSFGSQWWSWPFDTRPVFYYAQTFAKDLRTGISTFGNPLVWWPGVWALIYTVYLAVFERTKEAWFLAVMFFASFMPWVLVSRLTFIYHYFPCVPFMVLAIAYVFQRLAKSHHHLAFLAYGLAVFVAFVMFYPVIAGLPAPVPYIENWLKWLPGWQLI